MNQRPSHKHPQRLAAAGVLLCMLFLPGCQRHNPADANVSTHAVLAQSDREPIPASARLSGEALNAAIRKTMVEQYGSHYNTALNCWPHTVMINGEELDYCMQAGKAEVVDSSAGNRLFFMASNISDIDAERPQFLYSHPDQGLMGAFELKQDSAGAWVLVAASKALEFGSSGDCACADARFARVGRNTYGWLFTSGGVWQGVVVSKHNIVVPVDGQFKDVSQVPETEEARQGVTYTIALDDSDANATMYPLLVTENGNVKVDKRLVVNFDSRQGLYLLPRRAR